MNLNSPNLSPLDDIELWQKHTNSDAYAERALSRYREWKVKYPNGNGILNLGSCGLTTLPPEIGTLTSLKQLWCEYNHLTVIPCEIGALISLKCLDCASNALTTLPHEIGGLTSLIQLWCGENQLTTFPLEIGALTSLISLYCGNNLFAKGEPTIIEGLKERWRTHQMGRIKATRT